MKITDNRVEILIAPSYACNSDCAYCYTYAHKDKFCKEMDFELFKKIVEGHIKDGGTNVRLIGGEPTIWKYIHEAIIFCKTRNLFVTVLSNGIIPLQVFPSEVAINIKNYFDPKKKERIFKTLEFYKGKLIIKFRYNIEEKDTSEMFAQVGRLANRIGATIHFAPVLGYQISRELGKKIFDFACEMKYFDVEAKFDSAVALCLFTPPERVYLKENFGLYSICYPGAIPLINPDGETIQPCSAMHLPKNISKFNGTLRNAQEVFHEEIEVIRNKVPDQCKKCDFFLNKECQFGCMAARASDTNLEINNF